MSSLMRKCSLFTNSRLLLYSWRCFSHAFTSIDRNTETTEPDICGADRSMSSINQSLSSLLWSGKPQLSSADIKVVDLDTWRVSAGLTLVNKGVGQGSDMRLDCVDEGTDEMVNKPVQCEDALDLDDIEDMRIRRNLFYKIDRGSREFEEYKFEFHRRKSSTNRDDKRKCKNKEKTTSELPLGDENSSRTKNYGVIDRSGLSSTEKVSSSFVFNAEQTPQSVKEKYIVCANVKSSFEKKQRKPTFNQLTGPYHEPFCLDIYVSKGSVRASIIHRATSKVVAVAHSISKDMKFDMVSCKNASTCVAVGKILAQRALEDDIHNVIFTPRKGDKLEGKLQIVLQSILDNGVIVKIKLKQINQKKSGGRSTT